MPDLEIVHLSDLHWDSSKSSSTQVVVKPLLEDLRRTREEGIISPHMMVFTGDLVNAGEDRSQFDDAYDAFLAPAMDALGLTKADVFLCPGNHDISRSLVRDARYIDQGVRSTLTSVDAANDFLDKLKKQGLSELIVIQRMENYYDFLAKKFSAPDFSAPLLRAWRRTVNGLNVGIASFDTAWRATGESDDADRKHLLLGERNVDDAIDALSGADVKLALMHHPSDWLADFDEAAVSSRISTHFDVQFYGHMHRSNPQTRTSPQGSSVFSQTGSCYASRNWFNGYQTVKIDLGAGECEFIIRSYYDIPRRVFDKATNVATEGRVCLSLESQKKTVERAVVESFLRHTRPHIRAEASRHFTIVDSEALTALDAKEAFVVPPLSRKATDGTVPASGDSHEDRYEEVSVEEILRSSESFMFSGGRESGKTGLLHYIAVLCAEGTCDKPRIPVIINAEALKSGEYELKKAIAAYYGPLPRGFDVGQAIKDGAFLFLIDNFMSREGSADALIADIDDFKSNRWIVISRPRPGSITEDVFQEGSLADFRVVRIGALSRKSIRALSRKWASVIGSTDEDVFDAVMRQLKADGLPRTGYMVTLILWAMQQDKELERVNAAMLLSNVIDHLLGKADFTQASVTRLDPRAKEITLEYLAEFYVEKGGYVSVDEVVLFLSKLFRSRRLPFVSVDVLTELIRCGILDRQANIVSFKYKCFEEYFYALRMKSDGQILSRTLSEGVYPLRERQIEILSGLRRENKDIITAIRNDIRNRLPGQIERISRDDLFIISNRSVGYALSLKQINNLRKKRLTAEQVDDLIDAAEKKAIQRENEAGRSRLNRNGEEDRDHPAAFVLTSESPDKMSVSEYIVAVELLARVVRNSDFTDFQDKEPAARIVVEAFAKLCVLFNKEISHILNEQRQHQDPDNGLSEDDVGAIVYVMTNIVSRIIGERFAEQMCAPNVGPLMREICQQKETSLIERFFIVILMQSIRAKGWEVCWASLLRDSSKSGFIIESSIGKMRSIVHWQFLTDKEHEKLHKVIDVAEEVLGWTPAQKGLMLQDLKKVALQAERRDME